MSERAISDSNRKIAELAKQRRTANQKLAGLEAQQARLSGDIQVQQSLLSKQLYRQYTNGNLGYIEQFFDRPKINQLTRNLQYYQYIARERAIGLNALRDNLGMLKTTQVAIQDQSAELFTLKTEELAQRSNLQKEQQIKQQTLDKFSLQLRQQRLEVTRLRRDENQLAQLVNKLSKMLAQRKPDSKPGNTRLREHAFERLKGKLALPVRGTIRNLFGTPRPDGTVLWKGLFVKSKAGQPIKAVATGRVVFADWLRGFGNLLIVDHGMGYMSLYGNNETLFKQVGDLIKGGETIASVGNSGGNEESGLYFELRHESKPIDPASWLASK